MERGIAHGIQWCDTRGMTADGYGRHVILQARFRTSYALSGWPDNIVGFPEATWGVIACTAMSSQGSLLAGSLSSQTRLLLFCVYLAFAV
eukprot:6991335-Pyramimonas_sp.AAC.1